VRRRGILQENAQPVRGGNEYALLKLKPLTGISRKARRK
jgi:hypothetical protein